MVLRLWPEPIALHYGSLALRHGLQLISTPDRPSLSEWACMMALTKQDSIHIKLQNKLLVEYRADILHCSRIRNQAVPGMEMRQEMDGSKNRIGICASRSSSASVGVSFLA